MDAENACPTESRPPTVTDLLTVCLSLNEERATYMVVGGFAVNQHGFSRTTMDIDVLIEDSPENQIKAKRALEILPDKAVLELGDDDLRDWVVVRICDEVVVDLMTLACGVSYKDGESEIEIHTIDGVPIPFASATLLLRTKQTFREKDAEDRAFLEAKIARGTKSN